jgi:hypothetical protein
MVGFSLSFKYLSSLKRFLKVDRFDNVSHHCLYASVGSNWPNENDASNNLQQQSILMKVTLSRQSITRLTLTIAVCVQLIACGGSKKYIDLGQVRNGSHLDKAKEIELDTFLTVWLENTHPFKVDMNLNELYKDSSFTYFGKQTFKYQELLKIENEILKKVDYKSLNGDSIKTMFYEEIIPQEDRNKSNSKKCSWLSIKIDFNYKFIESENIIEISCRYKVVCESMVTLVKKDYHAKYDIGNRTLTKT